MYKVIISILKTALPSVKKRKEILNLELGFLCLTHVCLVTAVLKPQRDISQAECRVQIHTLALSKSIGVLVYKIEARILPS